MLDDWDPRPRSPSPLAAAVEPGAHVVAPVSGGMTR